MMKFVKAAREIQAKQKAKPLSAVAIKKVAKVTEGLSLSIAGIQGNPDGSFFVSTTKTGGNADELNPWDEVLPK
ncbi:hypothetical protein [Mesorhizobium sp. KR1-2]|uniref:hypothetical protein n=1 Tax=Mesorhizobium sp. KR1-2 TaxID=3156609 RepID=UPI0032B4FE4B